MNSIAKKIGSQLEGREICDYCGGRCYEKRYLTQGGPYNQVGFCTPECCLGYNKYVSRANMTRVKAIVENYCKRTVNIPTVTPDDLQYWNPSQREGKAVREDFFEERYKGLSQAHRLIAEREIVLER